METETHHFAQAKGNTVVQINGVGPWKLVYVNPADDPLEHFSAVDTVLGGTNP